MHAYLSWLPAAISLGLYRVKARSRVVPNRGPIEHPVPGTRATYTAVVYGYYFNNNNSNDTIVLAAIPMYPLYPL